MDTVRAEAREEKREVKRGEEGEQLQWVIAIAVVQ